jgi:hypothetical protein
MYVQENLFAVYATRNTRLEDFANFRMNSGSLLLLSLYNCYAVVLCQLSYLLSTAARFQYGGPFSDDPVPGLFNISWIFPNVMFFNCNVKVKLSP